jgi:DNA-directed RNA polymerase specialized sigma24 family protein
MVRAAAGAPSRRHPPNALSALAGLVTSMSDQDGSVTHWIDALKQGQHEAAEALWRRYYERAVAVARRRLGASPTRTTDDAEDVALSAFYGLCAGAAQGQFEQLNDRVDLWQLLTAITVKKSLGRLQWLGRLKRGGGRTSAAPSTSNGGDQANSDGGDPLPLVLSKEPTPECAAIIEEQFQELLEALADPTLRQIALWRMDGLSNAEIADKMGCVLRTVERKIERIRLIWEQVGAAPIN